MGKYVRRNLAHFKKTYRGFRNFDSLEKTYSGLTDAVTAKMFLVLFKTGCRVSESLELTYGHFNLDYSDNNIMGDGIPVSKQREKNPLWFEGIEDKEVRRFVKKNEFRSFPIRKDEPLSSDFIEFLNKVPENRKEEKILPYSRHNVYYRICNIESTLPPNSPKRDWWKYKGKYYPHYLRSLRATCLANFYDYDIKELQSWYGWSSSEMPMRYAQINVDDLAREGTIQWRKGSNIAPTQITPSAVAEKPIVVKPKIIKPVEVKPVFTKPVFKEVVPVVKPEPKPKRIKPEPKPKAEPKPAKDEVVPEPRKFGYMNQKVITSKYMLRDMIDEQIKEIKTTELYIIRKSKEDWSRVNLESFGGLEAYKTKRDAQVVKLPDMKLRLEKLKYWMEENYDDKYDGRVEM